MLLLCLDLINYILENPSYLNEQTTPSQTNFLCKYPCLSKWPCLSAKSACMTNYPTIWDDKAKARRCVWVKHLLNMVLETWVCQRLLDHADMTTDRAVPVDLATVVTGNVLKGRMSLLEGLFKRKNVGCLWAKKNFIQSVYFW